MIRTGIVGAVVMAGVLAFGSAGVRADALAVQSAKLTAADAAPFVGEWTLALEGPDGPGSFDLTVKVDNDKVVGEIAGPAASTHPITDITRTAKGLALRYSFLHEGNHVDTLVQLTPADGGKTNAEISFAGGAYVMSGSATKKEPAR